MSEFKFSCPNCDQHIACDDGWAGAQIQCPTCQAELTVPPPPAPPPAVSVSGPAVSPAARAQRPPSAPTGAYPAKEKTSGLAIASLVCSVLGCGLGFIPGIICGHLAKARMRSDPSLKGRGLATAGLIVGYTFAGLTLALAVAVVCFGLSLAHLAKLEIRRATGGEMPGTARPAGSGSPPATTKKATDLSRVSIPDTAASGYINTLFGTAFTCERAELRGDTLILRQRRESSTELTVEIMWPLFTTGVEGKSFSVAKDAMPGSLPQITTRERTTWAGFEGYTFITYTNGCTLQLEFGRKADGKIPGKIYLALPDFPYGESPLAGTFEVQAR